MVKLFIINSETLLHVVEKVIHSIALIVDVLVMFDLRSCNDWVEINGNVMIDLGISVNVILYLLRSSTI